MRFQRTILLSVVLLAAALAAQAQEAQPAAPPTVIKTETRLVLVDVVVTGKKGAYVEDLELKNFKVWEDNKEQQLKTFSFGADPKGPAGAAALHRPVLRQLHDGDGGTDAGAAGGGEVSSNPMPVRTG